jgi:hypothetical protein
LLRLYPNPSSGIVNIEFPNKDEEYYLVVRNTIGQKLFELKNQKEKSTVNLEDYENGVYLFEIISNEINSSFFVIKN